MSQTRSRLIQGTTISVVPLVFALLATDALLAPDSLTAQQGLGFEFSFGHQSVNGEYGDVLDGGVDADFSLVYTRGKLRYGIGSNWASYGVM